MKKAFGAFHAYLEEKTDLKPSAIEDILQYFKLHSTDRNEILVDYHEVCQSYFFIYRGILRNFTLNKEGVETSRYFAFEKMFTTSLPSFIEQKPTNEYLQSITKSTVLICDRDRYYQLLQTHSELDRLYRKILETRFITSQKLIYGFQGLDALDKIRWVVKNQPHLLLRVPHKMVASYLGISPSTLSRIKAKL